MRTPCRPADAPSLRGASEDATKMAGGVCLLLLAAFSCPGCLGDEEWEKYNLAPGEPCQSDEYCQSGVCRISTCQYSTRVMGLNCEKHADCNSQFCIYIVPGKGVCTRSCASTSCPDSYLCVAVLMASGSYEDYCFYRCSSSSGCDTNTICAQYEVDSKWSCLLRSTF